MFSFPYRWNNRLFDTTTVFSIGVGIGRLIPYFIYHYSEMLKCKKKKDYFLKNTKKRNPKCLVCGGTGYIGTHTIIALIEAGYDVVIVDNLSNSKKNVLERIRKITKVDEGRITLSVVDMCNFNDLESVFFESGPFDCCIHLAGYKAVGESVLFPLKYFENNIMSTINLLKLLDKFECHTLVFSSSATVYGTSNHCPFDEMSITGFGITNAYARTKCMIEQILEDFFSSKKKEYTGCENPWSLIVLRYFNPVGAHESGLLGEDPNGTPNNLLPLITQVLQGKKDKLCVYGVDYPTSDGSCLRDYIHVMDLAEGHVAALKYSQRSRQSKGGGIHEVFNLGSGKGHTVLEMMKAMENASGYKIPFSTVKRRPGDIASSYASVRKVNTHLEWKANRSLDMICKDTWNWILNSKK